MDILKKKYKCRKELNAVKEVESGISKEKVCNRTFYWNFRPIAVICKLSGVFPLMNVHSCNGRNVAFSYKSLAHLYSTLVFLILMVLLFVYCEFMLFPLNPSYTTSLGFLTSEETFAIFWKCLVAYLLLLRSCLSYWFCVHHLKALPILIKYLVVFDLKKASLLGMEHERGFFKWTLFPILVGAGTTYSYFSELSSFVSNDSNYTFYPDISNRGGIVFGALGIWQEFPMLVYIYFALIIVYDFKDLTEALRKRGVESQLLREVLTPKSECENLAEVLGNARHMHGILSAAVNELSNCYGGFMAADQFTIVVMLVVNIFTYFCTDVSDTHLLNITVQLFFAILSIVLVSHKIKDRALDILKVTQGIPLSTLDTSSRLEIQILTSQLAANPVQVSAAGFFVVDRTQINSIVTSVAAYLIVLIQFSSQVTIGMGTIKQFRTNFLSNNNTKINV